MFMHLHARHLMRVCALHVCHVARACTCMCVHCVACTHLLTRLIVHLHARLVAHLCILSSQMHVLLACCIFHGHVVACCSHLPPRGTLACPPFWLFKAFFLISSLIFLIFFLLLHLLSRDREFREIS